MGFHEPEIAPPDILYLRDEDFNLNNVITVTGVSGAIGRATAVAAAANNLMTVGLDINVDRRTLLFRLLDEGRSGARPNRQIIFRFRPTTVKAGSKDVIIKKFSRRPHRHVSQFPGAKRTGALGGRMAHKTLGANMMQESIPDRSSHRHSRRRV